MKLVAIILAVALSAQAQEAVQFTGRRELIIPSTGEVRWASDGGTCLTAPAWAKVDDELVRLQRVERNPPTDPSLLPAFIAGTVAGGLLTAGLLIGAWAVTR